MGLCSGRHLHQDHRGACRGGQASELALAIYRNNISGALVKTLSAAYPACYRILGESCFNGIARRFIEHKPSKQADLNHYGESFGEFLDSWTANHAAFSDYRYLGDVARLEWHCHTAYYAADAAAFDFNALAIAGCEAADSTAAGGRAS